MGANLFLNGSLRGHTPLSLDLPLGKYEIRLNHQNYHEWEAQLHLDEEGEMPLYVRLIALDSLAARFMVFGSYFLLGSMMRLDLRLVEVETSRILKAAQKFTAAGDLNGWLKAVEQAAAELI